MKPIKEYDLVSEAGEFKQLPKGIYLLKTTNAVDVPDKEYLELYFDVAKGEFMNYFKTLVDNGLKDTSRVIRSYKTNAIPFFKATITAFEKSNPGYNWDWDESKLVGKFVIGVVGEEEFKDKDGNVRIGTRIVELRSIEAFKEGRVRVPEIKRLPPEENPTPESKIPEELNVDDLDLPF